MSIVKPVSLLTGGASLWPYVVDFTDPNNPPALTTISHSTYIYSVTDDDPVEGLRVTAYAPNTIPYGYGPNFSHPSKLGALIEGSATNYCLHSQNFAGWGASSMVVNSDAALAPDLTMTADECYATIAGGALTSNIVGTGGVGTGVGVGSLFFRRGAGESSDVPLTFRLRNVGAGADIAITATDKWQRISNRKTFATDTRIDIIWPSGSQNRRVLLWGGQAEPNLLTSYIPTTTGAAARGAAILRFTGVPGEPPYLPEQGEMEAVFTFGPNAGGGLPTLNRVCGLRSSTTQNNRELYLPGGTTPFVTFRITIDTGSALNSPSLNGAAPDWQQEITTRQRWDLTNGLPGHPSESTDLFFNGGGYVNARDAENTVPKTWSNPSPTLDLGINRSNVQHLYGLLAKVTVYDEPRPDVP